MLISNLRLTFGVTYCGLLIWRSRLAGGLPPDWWLYVLGFGLLQLALTCAQLVGEWWFRHHVVVSLRGMSPEQRADWSRRFGSSSLHRRLFNTTLSEGEIARSAWAEAFPFARSAIAVVSLAFWLAVIFGFASLFALSMNGPALAPGVAWLLAGVSVVCAAVAGASRSRLSYMESRVEITASGIAHIDGSRRRSIRWSEPLLIRARPILRRIDLYSAASGALVPLDYDRIGIDYLVGEVLNRGGFQLAHQQSKTDPR